MTSDTSDLSTAIPNDHKQLLSLLDGYGVSELTQRLLALQLAGGCTRTRAGQQVRDEISPYCLSIRARTNLHFSTS